MGEDKAKTFCCDPAMGEGRTKAERYLNCVELGIGRRFMSAQSI